MEHVQTKREIRELLERYGFRPRKRFGQHFLVDGNLMRRLVESADIVGDDLVLEVGAGTGGLTDLLATRAGQVAAVEIDRDLFTILENRFSRRPHILLLNEDVLAGKHRLCDAIQQWLRISADRRVLLVANLPYQVATPLIVNLLVDYPNVRRMCFTVQTEVGDRILAPSGSRDYGPLTIIVQTLCRALAVTRLGPQVFWPQPAVDSMMIRLDVHEAPREIEGRPADFARFLRAVFDHRRKTLRSALTMALEGDRLLEKLAATDLSRRPEQVGVAEWLTVYAQLANHMTVGRA